MAISSVFGKEELTFEDACDSGRSARRTLSFVGSSGDCAFFGEPARRSFFFGERDQPAFGEVDLGVRGDATGLRLIKERSLLLVRSRWKRSLKYAPSYFPVLIFFHP